ncbi:hypothetical protein LXH09_29670 [Streptomyces sp. CS7]|nr:hypothetical protein [Streptomyces sp. CS-7]MCT6780814.1 hypothetical protein [Streptomyces sp. CS-7]
MDAIQQHMLDTYRAAQLSEPAPPPPGRHDRAVLRDLYRHWLRHPARVPGHWTGARTFPARPALEDGTPRPRGRHRTGPREARLYASPRL